LVHRSGKSAGRDQGPRPYLRSGGRKAQQTGFPDRIDPVSYTQDSASGAVRNRGVEVDIYFVVHQQLSRQGPKPVAKAVEVLAHDILVVPALIKHKGPSQRVWDQRNLRHIDGQGAHRQATAPKQLTVGGYLLHFQLGHFFDFTLRPEDDEIVVRAGHHAHEVLISRGRHQWYRLVKQHLSAVADLLAPDIAVAGAQIAPKHQPRSIGSLETKGLQLKVIGLADGDLLGIQAQQYQQQQTGSQQCLSHHPLPCDSIFKNNVSIFQANYAIIYSCPLDTCCNLIYLINCLSCIRLCLVPASYYGLITDLVRNESVMIP